MPPFVGRMRRHIAIGVGVAALITVSAASPSQAHVRVSSPSAEAGGYAKLIFRVPTESDTASTTKVTITLPTDHPLASVSTKPHVGWTAAVAKTKLATPIQVHNVSVSEAASTVTWTANSDSGIAPEQFDEFELSVGPLPDGIEQLTFPTVQTYSDGTSVSWSDVAKNSDDEPEHPAPTLAITKTASTESAAATSASGDDDNASSDNISRGLGGFAVVLALLALTAALKRRRA